MTEDAEDKAATIEELTSKVDILQNDKNYIKKSYDSLLAKHKKMRNENILIPKEKKDEESKDNRVSMNIEDDLTTNLQEEVRKLHS